MEDLRKQGVRVDILQADLADKKQLTEKLAPYLEEHSKTPLRRGPCSRRIRRWIDAAPKADNIDVCT